MWRSKEVAETSNGEHGKEMNDSTELAHIRMMRAIVTKKDSSSKEEDDLTLRRFLRARDQDIEKASALFLDYLKWRRTFVPNGSISTTEIQSELSHNKMFVQGVDKKGRPVLTFICRNHLASKSSADDIKRLLVYSLDKVFSRMPPGQEKFLVIIDLKGWGYQNFDSRAVQGAFSILQDCYPERLEKIFVVQVPYIFMAAWKLIYKFIDKRTRKKVEFVENKKLMSTLVEEIDEGQILDIFGGKLPLVSI